MAIQSGLILLSRLLSNFRSHPARHVQTLVPPGDRLPRRRHGPLLSDELLHGRHIPPLKVHLGRRDLHQLLPRRHRRGLRRPAREEDRPDQHHGLHARPVVHGRPPVSLGAVFLDHGPVPLRPRGPEQHGPSAALGIHRRSGEARGANRRHGHHEHVKKSGGHDGTDGHGYSRRRGSIRQRIHCGGGLSADV